MEAVLSGERAVESSEARHTGFFAQQASDGQGPFTGYRALVADDHEVNLKLMQALLWSLGLEVDLARRWWASRCPGGGEAF